MAKKPVQRVDIEFVGSGVVIPKVQIINVGRGKGGKFIRLDGLTLLHTSFDFIERASTQPVELVIVRPTEDSPQFRVADTGEILDIGMYTVLHHARQSFFYIEELQSGTYRICHPSSLFESTANVSSIRITPSA